jgi:hypothetical protein
MKFLSDIRLLLIGLWLGGAVFFMANAEVTFSAVQQRDAAGQIVGRSLSILDYGGIGIAAVLIVTSLIGAGRINSLGLWVERFLLLVVGAACAVQEFVIKVWMASILASIGGPIDNVAADDPQRIRFDQLHGYSAWILLASLAAAVITFFIVANRAFGAGKVDKKDDVYDFSKEFKI